MSLRGRTGSGQNRYATKTAHVRGHMLIRPMQVEVTLYLGQNR